MCLTEGFYNHAGSPPPLGCLSSPIVIATANQSVSSHKPSLPAERMILSHRSLFNMAVDQ